jgi:uncharacterized protein (DUF433 family)
MHYWFSGQSHILTPAGHIGDVALLSFRDMAEAYVLELLRSYYGFRLPRLRDLIVNFSKETRAKRPLLESDLYVVLGTLVLEKPARGRRPRRAVDLAQHGRNLVFPELIEMIGKRVLRDRHHAPYRLFPWRLASAHDESTPVSMDPEVASGRLVVTGTRVPVSILLGRKLKGNSVSEIAKSYRLDAETVEKALQHIERPLRTKAA